MSPTPGQLTFEGAEVAGIVLDLPGFAKVDYTLQDGEKLPRIGDEIQFVMTAVVESIGHKEEHDREGLATDNLRRIIGLKWLRRSQFDGQTAYTLMEVRRREDIQSMWATRHGKATAPA